MYNSQYLVKIIFSIQDIEKKIWDELIDEIDNPFFKWNWLRNLELSKSVSNQTGWQPLYFIALINNQIQGIAPLFLKNHSYGEFIFDQSIANLAQDLNLNYYPKLIGMSPYSPVKGYQFLYKNDSRKSEITEVLINYIEEFAIKNNILSCNFLYVDDQWGDLLKKYGYQNWINITSEWRSNGEKSFDEYLSRFNSNQRKNIKKERNFISKNNMIIKTHTGDNIDLQIMKKMHDFYEKHCLRWGVWGSKYLSYDFFKNILITREDLLIFSVCKESEEEAIAMSMCIKNKDNLWGRYWGCNVDMPNLHFELCYYQPIEWAIKNNIKYFDPGAGGKHKRRRGFYATPAQSFHKWFNLKIENIVKQWMYKVNESTFNEIKLENDSIPFKK